MRAHSALLGTSVGAKALVAVSGLAFAAWCALHVLGNVAAFAGPAALDGYAAWLRGAYGVPLWCLRATLAAVVGAHMVLGLVLWRRARRARGERHRVRSVASHLPSRLVRWCGLALAIFLVFHVLHINYGLALPGFVRGHVYDNLKSAFASPLVVGVYLLASALVGLHLAHGAAAALSSLGVLPPSTGTHRAALLAGSLWCLGFAATPLAMALGVLR